MCMYFGTSDTFHPNILSLKCGQGEYWRHLREPQDSKTETWQEAMHVLAPQAKSLRASPGHVPVEGQDPRGSGGWSCWEVPLATSRRRCCLLA